MSVGVKTTSWFAVPDVGTSDVSAKANVPATLASPPDSIAAASDWPERIDVAAGRTATVGAARATSTSTSIVNGMKLAVSVGVNVTS